MFNPPSSLPASLLDPRASVLCRSLLLSHQELPFAAAFISSKFIVGLLGKQRVQGGPVPTLSSRLVCIAAVLQIPDFVSLFGRLAFKKKKKEKKLRARLLRECLKGFSIHSGPVVGSVENLSCLAQTQRRLTDCIFFFLFHFSTLETKKCNKTHYSCSRGSCSCPGRKMSLVMSSRALRSICYGLGFLFFNI